MKLFDIRTTVGATGRTNSSRHKNYRKRPDVSAKLKALWDDPEFREKMKQRDAERAKAAKDNPAKFSRAGVPDGMRRRHAKHYRAHAEAAANRFIERMEEEEILPKVTVPGSDEEMAKEALREAFTLAVMPGDAKVKTANIRTVLEWTKSKPASKQQIDLTSNDWLDAAVKEMKQHDDDN